LISFLVNLLKKYIDIELLVKPYIHYLGIYVRKFRSPFYITLAVGFLGVIGFTLLLSLAKIDVKTSSYDLAIQKRLDGPSASSEIVIIDIDEKSIAELSPKFGRWPWSRELMAEVIAGLGEHKPSVIFMNMLISEPDIQNKQSDATFNEVLKMQENVVMPWVRLNSKNDSQSQFKVQDIPGYSSLPDQSADISKNNIETIALIPSLFSDAKNHHGFSNLSEDEDGLIRQFKVRHSVYGGSVPSAALIAAQLHTNKTLENIPDSVYINWRNKRNAYERISFSDFYKQLQGGEVAISDAQIKGKIFLIGVSAPGLANLKPTSSSSLMDDNELMATVIDDLVNDTHLRLMPVWLDKLISVILIILFCLAFVVGSFFWKINTLVGVVQSGLAVITLGFVSYTNYFVDLTECIAFSLSYFGFCKIHQSIDERASRAEELFSFSELDEWIKSYSLILFKSDSIGLNSLARIKRQLELTLGSNNIYILDNVFDGSNLLETSLKPLKAILIFSAEASAYDDTTLYYYDKKNNRLKIDLTDANLHHQTRIIESFGLRLTDEVLQKNIATDFLELSKAYLKDS
jgi:CHASE2 domain-containing sensor protein